MGKTSKPLTILAHPSLANCPEVKALQAKGHEVRFLTFETETADIILGPNCWRMDESLLQYVDMAVRAARANKYDTSKPKADDN